MPANHRVAPTLAVDIEKRKKSKNVRSLGSLSGKPITQRTIQSNKDQRECNG